jgi:hypothetical protein
MTDENRVAALCWALISWERVVGPNPCSLYFETCVNDCYQLVMPNFVGIDK